MADKRFRAWDIQRGQYLERQFANQLFLTMGGQLLWHHGDFDDVTDKFEIEWAVDKKSITDEEIFVGDRVKSDEYEGIVEFGAFEAFCGFVSTEEDEDNLYKDMIGFHVGDNPIGKNDEIEIIGNKRDPAPAAIERD